MKASLAVTGAAGFIGRNVVEELNRRGRNDLLLVDRLGNCDKWRNLVGLRFENLVSPEAFLEELSGNRGYDIEAIVHLGACSATTERDADFLWQNNYLYTRRLCEWALKRRARFIYASSAATYGDGSLGYVDSEENLEALRPLNMYGYSKHAFDLWACREELFQTIAGLKYFNVFGPYEDHKGDMRSLVHKAYGQILERGYIELFRSDNPKYADGEQMRDFVYVRDVVKITLHFLDNPEINGLFNCGSGQARTWLELANALFAAMGRETDVRFIEMPEKLRGRYQYFTEATMDKLRLAGRYQEGITPLDQAVKDYVMTHLATHLSSYGA